MTILKMT